MSILNKNDNDKEYIEVIRFEHIDSSPYMKPFRMHFKRKNQLLFWDMAMEHDSVACIVYHKEKNSLILVKQFRPPVFIKRIKKLSENIGKKIEDIDFNKYDINVGKTFELCAGLMDKKSLTPLETIHEELIEEIGYNVSKEKIFLLKEIITSVSMSGSCQYLFYTEVDESMKIFNGGGGNSHEGEYIETILLPVEDARKEIEKTRFDSPTGLLYAITWFLHKYDTNTLPKL